jgi:hypothetical protein
MTLSDYLDLLRSRRWQPGILDCGVFMADWVLQVCGRDPIADVRGSYTTEMPVLRGCWRSAIAKPQRLDPATS